MVAGIQLSLLITSQKNGEIVLRPCTRHSTNALPTTNHSRSNSASEDALVIVRHALVLRLRGTEVSVGIEVIQSLGTFSSRSRSPKHMTSHHTRGWNPTISHVVLTTPPTRDQGPSTADRGTSVTVPVGCLTFLGPVKRWLCPVVQKNDPIHQQPPHQLSRRILTGHIHIHILSYHHIIIAYSCNTINIINPPSSV